MLLVSFTLLFVHRQRKPRDVPKVLDKSNAAPRWSVDPGGYTVEYHSAPDPSPAPTLPTASAVLDTDTDSNTNEASTVSLPASETSRLRDLALTSLVSTTNSVDLDVGTPVENDTLNAATVRMADVGAGPSDRQQAARASGVSLAPVDDERMTITIAELDLLREDYEAEHTLTQQLSRELRAAVADLEATKAARADAGESARSESLQRPGAEMPDPRGGFEGGGVARRPNEGSRQIKAHHRGSLLARAEARKHCRQLWRINIEVLADPSP